MHVLNHRRIILFMASSCLAGGTGFVATAQAATQQTPTNQSAAPMGSAMEPASDGEIVVTAQRRAEKVTSVPISITVADQAQLERQQVNTVNDLSRIAPSLEIQSASGQNTGGGGSVRGIGTQTFNAGATASVGIVVDQVSQGNANIADLFDVARIEVLKGPQGTLFGLTTSAGVINITTNKPDFKRFSMRVRTELSKAGTAGSKFGDQVVQGVVNIPLASNAALRMSGSANLRQGVDRNVTTGKLNSIDDYAVRTRFLWEPTGKLAVNLIADYGRVNTTGGGDFFTFVKAGGPTSGIFGILQDPRGVALELAGCGVTATQGNRDYCSSKTLRGSTDTFGASIQFDYDAGPFTLTSISAYRGQRASSNGDVFRTDPIGLQIESARSSTPINLYTQELRVSSPGGSTVEYTAGAFVSHQKTVQNPSSFNVFTTNALFIDLGPPIGLVPAGGANPVHQLGTLNRITDTSMALFGQATYHATDALRLIVGGRYSSERLALTSTSLDANATSIQVLNTSKFSWRLGAQYQLARRLMAYGTVNRGYKGGQIAIPSLPLTPYVVQPEIPTAFEAGLKATLFGGWIADLNVFHENIRNFQAQQCIVVAVTNALSCAASNIDGVKSRGAELNLFGKVTHDLSLSTGFIWAKATYPKDYLGTDGTNIGGTQLANAPAYKFTLSGEYAHPVSRRADGFVAIDTVWKSRIRYEANAIGDTTFRPHWTVGGRLGLRTPDQNFSAAIFVRNLFNVHEPVLMQSSFPYDGAQNVGAVYGPMSFRQVGLSLDGKF